MKIKMKKAVLTAAIMAAVASPGTAQMAIAGGIPVIDAAGLVQAQAQVTHMLTQIENLKDQLDNMQGSRGLANVVNTAYDIAMDVDTAAVLENAGIKSAGEHKLTEDLAELYNNGNENTATWLAQSYKSLQQSQDRFSDLTGLVAKVNASPDQKDILDLQARISAEQAFLQNEQAKLTMLQSLAEANEAMHQQRIQQMAIESVGELK